MSQPGGLFTGNCTPPAGPQAPPIVELARFLGQALSVSTLLRLLFRTTGIVTLILSIIVPATFLYYPFTHLLAPIIVLAQVLFDLPVFMLHAIVLSVTGRSISVIPRFGDARRAESGTWHHLR